MSFRSKFPKPFKISYSCPSASIFKKENFFISKLSNRIEVIFLTLKLIFFLTFNIMIVYINFITYKNI